MTATKGQIATWNIGTNSLWNGGSEKSPTLYYGTSGITVTIGGASRSNIIFKAGSDFGVDNTGKVYANNLTITGGSFKIGSNFKVTTDGTLTAKSGTLGGWTVDANGLRNLSNTAVLTPSQFKLGAFSVASTGAITAGSNFSVSSTGIVTAAIGTFGSGWYISSGALSTNRATLNLSTDPDILATMLFEGMNLVNKSANVFQIMGFIRPSLSGKYYNEGIIMGRETCIYMHNYSAIYLGFYAEFICTGHMYLTGPIFLDGGGKVSGQTTSISVLLPDGKTSKTL